MIWRFLHALGFHRWHYFGPGDMLRHCLYPGCRKCQKVFVMGTVGVGIEEFWEDVEDLP